MGNPFEKMGENFEPSQAEREAAEDMADREAKFGRLNNAEQRRADLEAWSRSWTPDDRRLADQLDSQIIQLKKELGE